MFETCIGLSLMSDMIGTALLILSIAGGNKNNDEDFRSNLIYASSLDLASPNPRSETQLEKRSHTV